MIGPRVNTPFLSALVTHPALRSGRLDTGFIARHLDQLLDADPAVTARLLHMRWRCCWSASGSASPPPRRSKLCHRGSLGTTHGRRMTALPSARRARSASTSWLTEASSPPGWGGEGGIQAADLLRRKVVVGEQQAVVAEDGQVALQVSQLILGQLEFARAAVLDQRLASGAAGMGTSTPGPGWRPG